MSPDSASAVPQDRMAGRFVFIDALRGLACLWVLTHHLFFNEIFGKVLRPAVHNAVEILAFCGSFGVQIFFVLSGFVIAHSLRDTTLNPRSVGLFILRRQLRLDPPYWVM